MSMLLTFQKFNDPALAEIIASHLQDQGITCVVSDEDIPHDVNFANHQFEPTIHLKIPQEDFTRAQAALESYYQSQLSTMDPDYYLFTFTNEELMDIIRHPDEWGHLDYALAKKLLADRGQPISADRADLLKHQRIFELAKAEPTHPAKILVGYLGAMVSGIVGILIGYSLSRARKTLPNGEQVYVYPPSERRHGRRILILGVLFLAFWIWLTLSRRHMYPMGPL
jgi:hypothetical protein